MPHSPPVSPNRGPFLPHATVSIQALTGAVVVHSNRFTTTAYLHLSSSGSLVLGPHYYRPVHTEMLPPIILLLSPLFPLCRLPVPKGSHRNLCPVLLVLAVIIRVKRRRIFSVMCSVGLGGQHHSSRTNPCYKEPRE